MEAKMVREEAIDLFNKVVSPKDINVLMERYNDGEIVEDIIMESMKLAIALFTERLVPVVGTKYDGKQVYVRAGSGKEET